MTRNRMVAVVLVAMAAAEWGCAPAPRRPQEPAVGRPASPRAAPIPAEDPRAPPPVAMGTASEDAATAASERIAEPDGPPAARGQAEDSHLTAERERMVRDLLRHEPRVTSPPVLEAMRNVPRHRFMPQEARSLAYEDMPVAIGHGQTISQPYIVAFMTELAEVDAGTEVLEVGTGSGYQAAVLAELGADVATIEIVPQLAATAKASLEAQGYGGVATRTGDGYFGWPERAPFDRILVTAAATHVPPPLLEQLAPGGRMVIPVGTHWGTQELLVVTKDADGSARTRSVLPVRFVPLTGGTSRE